MPISLGLTIVNTLALEASCLRSGYGSTVGTFSSDLSREITSKVFFGKRCLSYDGLLAKDGFFKSCAAEFALGSGLKYNGALMPLNPGFNPI